MPGESEVCPTRVPYESFTPEGLTGTWSVWVNDLQESGTIVGAVRWIWVCGFSQVWALLRKDAGSS